MIYIYIYKRNNIRSKKCKQRSRYQCRIISMLQNTRNYNRGFSASSNSSTNSNQERSFCHNNSFPSQKHSLSFLIQMELKNTSSRGCLQQENKQSYSNSFSFSNRNVTGRTHIKEKDRIPRKQQNHVFRAFCSNKELMHNEHFHRQDPENIEQVIDMLNTYQIYQSIK